MADKSEYEYLKKRILREKSVNADCLSAFLRVLSSVNISKDLPDLLPVVWNYAFHEDILIKKAAIPVLQKFAELLELNVDIKTEDWWPDMKTTISNSINKISAMVSDGQEEWCMLWCIVVTVLGKDLRPSIKMINALLKVAEKAFKTSNEKDRAFECWRKLIDNFALCPNDMDSPRRLNLLLIPLQAHNHSTKDSFSSKLKTWKHLLSNLESTNEATMNLVLPPFLQFMYEGAGAIPPACNILPNECADLFKLLLTTKTVFQVLSQQFINKCGPCIVSLQGTDPVFGVRVWLAMLSGVKKMSWPVDRVLDIVLQLKFLFEKNGSSGLFTDILETTYSSGLPISLLCKHYNSLIEITISPHVICNMKEHVLKSFVDIMDHMNSFILSEGTFQLVNDKLYALSESKIKEEMKNDLKNNLKIIWLSLCDGMYKWISNGGHCNEERTKEDMQLVHNVLIFGITRLDSQWNKSILRSWKLLFSESLKYFLLLLVVNSEQFVVDLIEKIVKAVKNEQVSLLIAVEVSSILMEYTQSKESDSLTYLLMEVGEKILMLFTTDMRKGVTLLNQFLKALLIAVRSRPLLASACISVTENLSKVKLDLPVTENQKISAKIMKTKMQLVSLKTVKTVEKCDSPLPSPPAMTSFLQRLAKAEGNKTRTKVSSSQALAQETKPLSQLSPKPVIQGFMDSSSQDDYVFVPPKKTVIPLTEHQKERMATRRSDIPALYQDLSQDSQSINLESISFSQVNCKSPSKNKSSSNNLTHNFSGIEFGKNSPLKKDPKFPTKSIIPTNYSPSKCQDEKKKVKLFDNTLEQAEENDILKPVSMQKLQKSPNKLLVDTAVVDNGLQNKTRLTVNLNKEIFSDVNLEKKINKSPEKSVTQVDVNGHNLKVFQSFEPVTNNKSDSASNDITSVDNQKTSVITNENVDISTDSSKKDGKKSEEKANNSEKCEPSKTQKGVLNSDDVIGVKPKFRKNKKLSVKKIFIETSNVSNNITDVKNNIEKDLNKVTNEKDEINFEPLIENQENKNKVTQFKEKNEKVNCGKICVDQINVNNNGQTIEIDTIKDMSELKESKTDDNTQIIELELPVKKQDKLRNKISPLKVKNENKKNTRKSLPSKFSPIKTRRSSPRLLKSPMIKHKKTKSVPIGNPELLNCNRNILESEQCDYNVDKRKLNESVEKNTSNNITKSNNKTISTKEKDNDMKKFELTTDICDKNIVDCNSNTDMRDTENVKQCVTTNICSEKTTPEVCLDEKELENTVWNQSQSLTVMKEMDNYGVEGIKNNCINTTSDNVTVFATNENEEENTKADVYSNMKEDHNISVTCNTEMFGSHSNKICNQSNEKHLTELENSETAKEELLVVGNEIAVTQITVLNSNSKSRSKLETNVLTKIENVVLVDKEKSSEICKFSNSLTKHNTVESLISNNSKAPVVCITNMCVTPVKRNREGEYSVLDKKDISSRRTQVLLNLENRFEPKNLKELNQKESDVVEISLTSEDIEILDSKKCIKKSNIGNEVIHDESVAEERSLDSVYCKGVKGNVEVSDKNVKSTPQKITKRQIEFLKHSPIINKVDTLSCTPPKEITKDISVIPEPTSMIKSNDIKQLSGSKKPKKLTSNILSDWVLRTPIKKSPEVATDNDPVTNICDTLSPEVHSESVDLIPSSQEDGKSLELLEIVEKLSDLKTLSPNKRNVSPTCKKNSTFNQNELLEVNTKINIDLVSPRKSNTPVKKSVRRRLVVDSDKEMLEDDFDNVNSSVPNSIEINKLEVPVLTSDKEYDHCKELIVQCSEEFISGPENLITCESESTADQAQIYDPINNTSVVKKRSTSQSPKKSSDTDVIVLSSPKSPKRRTSQLMALAFKKDDSGDLSTTQMNKKQKKNQLLQPADTCIPENQQSESTPVMEAWICRIYSPSASPNTSILKRKAQCDISVEPSSPVQRDKRKRVSFLDPVVSESLVFSKSEFGKGQIMRAEPKQIELDTQSQGSVSIEVETGDSQVTLFPALETCTHPVSNILSRDVTKQWMTEMEASLQRLGVTTVGELCKLSEATVMRLPFPPPKVKRLCTLLQEYFDEISNSPPKKVKMSPTKCQCEAEKISTCITSNGSEESLNNISERVVSYFQTYPELVESLGQTLEVDTIMTMLNVAITKLKSKQNL